jgi:hypothetical protein
MIKMRMGTRAYSNGDASPSTPENPRIFDFTEAPPLRETHTPNRALLSHSIENEDLGR